MFAFVYVILPEHWYLSVEIPFRKFKQSALKATIQLKSLFGLKIVRNCIAPTGWHEVGLR